MAAKLCRLLSSSSKILPVNAKGTVHIYNLTSSVKRNYLTISKVCPNKFYPPISVSCRGHKILTWPTPEFLPFKWERVRDVNPIDVTGDLDLSLPSLDPSTPRPGFQLSEELKTANVDVKKIFTVATASQKEITQLILEDYLSKFRRNAMDVTSPEAKIAMATVKVRTLAKHFKQFPRDKQAKVQLFHAIDRRNMFLTILRQSDYRRFEWILKELKITYRRPKDGKLERITRKGEIRRLTREYCEKIINEKLQKYHEELKQQQEAFLKEKEDTLRRIEEEKQQLGITE